MNTLEKGDKLPNFVLKDQNGIEHKSTDYLGKKIIIFFYPRANTPGCTAEVCDLRDNYELLKVKGYNLIGVSGDNEKNQLKFHQKFELPFPLLADVDKELIKSFGVWGKKKFMGKEFMGLIRSTFLLKKNNIIKEWRNVRVNGHAEEIYNFLKKI